MSSTRLVQHESAATALAINSMLRCRQIDSHYGIVAPFSVSRRRDVHDVF